MFKTERFQDLVTPAVYQAAQELMANEFFDALIKDGSVEAACDAQSGLETMLEGGNDLNPVIYLACNFLIMCLEYE